MTAQKKIFTLDEAHQAFGPGIYNRVWELLEKENRTAEEDELMINAAHASLYHWRSFGKPKNFQIGEWMLAHVYTILAMGESALHHAQICLDLTLEHGIDDFDLSFGYEGYARAQALNGDMEVCQEYFDKAEDSAQQIKKQDDRDYFLQVLQAGPWFGFVR